MRTKPIHFLPVIDASQEDWEEKSDWESHVRQALVARSNFVVVFDHGAAGLTRLAQMLDCHPSEHPETLSKWAIHGLMDALQPQDYQWLLSRSGSCDIRLVEQLNLRCNRPPEVQPYVIYDEARGFISSHETADEAREALWDYVRGFRRYRALPWAGLYAWKNYEWQPMQKL